MSIYSDFFEAQTYKLKTAMTMAKININLIPNLDFLKLILTLKLPLIFKMVYFALKYYV